MSPPFPPGWGLMELLSTETSGMRDVFWPPPVPLPNGGCGLAPAPVKVVNFLELSLLPLLWLAAEVGLGGGGWRFGGGWRGAGGGAIGAGMTEGHINLFIN